mgnify:FL=1
MFARTGRLNSSRDFARIYRKGQAARSSLFRIAWMTAARTRVAVVTGRKVSTKAVVRNRFKRQVRAAIRALLSRLQPVDLIIQLQPAMIVGTSYETLATDLQTLLERSKLIR